MNQVFDTVKVTKTSLNVMSQVFDTVRVTKTSLNAMTQVFDTVRITKTRMRSVQFINSTQTAVYLWPAFLMCCSCTCISSRFFLPRT